MIVVAKTSKELLTFGLSAPEFACKCKSEYCDVIFISKKLLAVYKRFRYLVDTKLTITSGHRCLEYNKLTGGVKFSQHLIGYAIDVDAKKLLLKYDEDDIISLAREAGFTFVKYYKELGFFHFDVRSF